MINVKWQAVLVDNWDTTCGIDTLVITKIADFKITNIIQSTLSIYLFYIIIHIIIHIITLIRITSIIIIGVIVIYAIIISSSRRKVNTKESFVK